MTYRIPLFKVLMAEGAGEAVAKTLQSGYVACGPKVAEFEKALEPVLGPGPVVALNSGTTALELAYHMCGLHAGDTVISTPITCLATNAYFARNNINILWADVTRSGCIDIDDVNRKWLANRSRVKAIVVVNWGGRVVDLSRLQSDVCGTLPPIIVDNAHGFMTQHSTHKYSGDIYWCYSFQAIKHLTTGDGGALVCQPMYPISDRARRLAWFGLNRAIPEPFINMNLLEPGFKYHMNDIAATIGLANLPLAIDAVKTQQGNARTYHKAFVGLRRIATPAPDDTSSWWLYTLIIPKGRNEFIVFMRERGIEVGRAHSRNDAHGCFIATGNLPGVDQFDSMQVNIPVGWWLTGGKLNEVIAAVKEWDER
jgi:dTDP-4-amino-4,6-dideoxygalactose transaminase